MSDGRSAVRHRNHEAILDAAMARLVADPRAGMADIAAHAGVGRATLYRHYATREALIEALQERTRAAFRALLGALRADPDPFPVALERFVARLLDLREGWVAIAPRATDDRRARAVWSALEDHVRERQARGEVDPALPPAWVLASLRGQLRAAVAELDAGALDRAAAPALMVRSLLRGVSS